MNLLLKATLQVVGTLLVFVSTTAIIAGSILYYPWLFAVIVIFLILWFITTLIHQQYKSLQKEQREKEHEPEDKLS
jgi:membrane protein implicated in regulation of membrane protease activity